MRSCGKRLFTPACKWVVLCLKDAVRLLPGRIFFGVWWEGVFSRFFANSGCFGVVKLW
jgi:hypothetical protein